VLTQQRDLILLAVKGHKRVQAATDASCSALLNAIAQEDNLSLVSIQDNANNVALGEAGCICCHTPAAHTDDTVAQVVGPVT
jgi:hypothetical protein